MDFSFYELFNVLQYVFLYLSTIYINNKFNNYIPKLSLSVKKPISVIHNGFLCLLSIYMFTGIVYEINKYHKV